MQIEQYAERVEADEVLNEAANRAIRGNNTDVGRCAYCGMPLFVRAGTCHVCQNCGTTTGCG